MALINIKKCRQPHGSRHLSLLPYFQPIILSIAAIGVYDACDVGQAQGDKHQGEPPWFATTAALAVALHGCLPLRLLCHRNRCRVGALRNRRCFSGSGRLVSRARPSNEMQHLARSVGFGMHNAVGCHRPYDAIGCLGLLGTRFCAAVRPHLRLLGRLSSRLLGDAEVALLVAAASCQRHNKQRYCYCSHCFTYSVMARTCRSVSSALPASLSKYATSSRLSWNRFSVNTAAHFVSRSMAKLAIQ